jgi:hypothetical protein
MRYRLFGISITNKLQLIFFVYRPSGVLEYDSGYWHDGLDLSSPVESDTDTTYSFKEGAALNNRSKFYRCRGNCAVEKHRGGVICQSGSRGVLCGICADGLVAGANDECTPCKASVSDIGWIMLLLAVTTSFIVVSLYAVRFQYYTAILTELQKKLTSKFKLTTAFYSITLMVGSVYEVRWPQAFLDYLVSRPPDYISEH